MRKQKSGVVVDFVKGIGNWLLPGNTGAVTEIPGEEDISLFDVNSAEEHIRAIRLNTMSPSDDSSKNNAGILIGAERGVIKKVIQDRVKALSRVGKDGPLFFDCYFIVSDEIYRRISQSDADYGSGEVAVLRQELEKMFAEQLHGREVRVYVKLESNTMLGMRYGKTYALDNNSFVFIAPLHLTITEGRTELPKVIGKCKLLNHQSKFEHEAPIFQNQPRFRIGHKWYDNIHEPSMPLPLNIRLTPDNQSVFISEILEPLLSLVGQGVQKDPVNNLVYRVERPDENSYRLFLYTSSMSDKKTGDNDAELDGVWYTLAFTITLSLSPGIEDVEDEKQAETSDERAQYTEQQTVSSLFESENKTVDPESGVIYESYDGSRSILIREPELVENEMRSLVFTHRMLPYPNPNDPIAPFSEYRIYVGSQGDVVARKEDAILELAVDMKNLTVTPLTNDVRYSRQDDVLTPGKPIVFSQSELKRYEGRIQFRKDDFDFAIGENFSELSRIEGFFTILDTEPDHIYSFDRDEGLLVIGRHTHAAIQMPSGRVKGKEYQKTGVSRLHGLYDSENAVLYNISNNFPIYLIRNGELILLEKYPVALGDITSANRRELYISLRTKMVDNEPEGIRLRDGDWIIIGGMVFRYDDVNERRQRFEEKETPSASELETDKDIDEPIAETLESPKSETKTVKPAGETEPEAESAGNRDEGLLVTAIDEIWPPVEVAPFMLKFVGWWLRDFEKESEWPIGFTNKDKLVIPVKRGENLGQRPPRMPVSWVNPELKIPDLEIVLTRDDNTFLVPFGVGVRIRFESAIRDNRMNAVLKIGGNNALSIPAGGILGLAINEDGKLKVETMNGISTEDLAYGLTSGEGGVQWVEHNTLLKFNFETKENDFLIVERRIYQLCRR